MPGPALAVGDSQNNSGLAQGPLGASAAASACGTCPNGPTGGAQLKREGGPWQNAKRVVVASSVEDLNWGSNNITKQTAVTEKGEMVSGRGDAVNTHDILTGSDPQGLYSTAGGDTTCGNWTKSGEGSAIVGHHDRAGLKDNRHMNSWNSSHGSRAARMPEEFRRRRPDLLLRSQLSPASCRSAVPAADAPSGDARRGATTRTASCRLWHRDPPFALTRRRAAPPKLCVSDADGGEGS